MVPISEDVSGVYVCVAAAASDERNNVKAEESAVLVSDDTIAKIDPSSVATGLNVVVVFISTTSRLVTNAASAKVVIPYEVVAWVIEIDERTRDADSDKGLMILGKIYVVDEFTAPIIDVLDVETAVFEVDVKLTGVDRTPILSALMISAAFEQSQCIYT